MRNLPNVGQPVYVWPHPGLKVQDGPLAMSDGGRWLPPDGRSVVWDEYRYRQFLAGELHLTDPSPPVRRDPAPPAARAATPAAATPTPPMAAPAPPVPASPVPTPGAQPLSQPAAPARKE